MWKNYLRVSLRHLLKNRLYSLINITGLSIAIATVLLIGLYVHHEYSYDDFHPAADRIHKVWVKEQYEGESFFYTQAAKPVGDWLEANAPGIEATQRVMQRQVQLRDAQQLVHQEIIQLVDPGFFHFFGFELKSGEAGQVLSDLQQVVLSEEMAMRYFGNPAPIGQVLYMQLGTDFLPFEVSGVVKSDTSPSTVPCSILVPIANTASIFPKRALQSWYNTYSEVYLKLSPHATAQNVLTQKEELAKAAMGDRYEPNVYTIGLLPLQEVYLNSEVPAGYSDTSDPAYSYMLTGIALIILAVACFNFMTIAVGASAKRALEVGVRKVNGALRADIRRQFLTEAFIVCLCALLFGLLLTELLLPLFEQLANKSLSLHYSPKLVLALIGGALLLAVLTGFYPALVLAALSPARVIKGASGFKPGRERLRKGMVALQFAASVGLISVTLLMQQQLSFLQDHQLGFEQERLIYLPYAETLSGEHSLSDALGKCDQQTALLRQSLQQVPGVLGVSQATHGFGPGERWTSLFFQTEGESMQNLRVNGVDEHYIPTLAAKLVDGRNFNPELSTDLKQAVIVNETLLHQFQLSGPGDYLPGPYKQFQIIGVVSDFHINSLHEQLSPAFLTMNVGGVLEVTENLNTSSLIPVVLLKLTEGNPQKVLAQVKAQWEQLFPGQPFDYRFVDDRLQRHYDNEQRLGTLFTLAGALAILIGLLGLTGLVSLSLSRRVKELGIRKILGASLSQQLILISKEFIPVIGLGTLLAVPLTWYFMEQWLQSFAYRITISPLVYLLALVAVTTMAMTVISLRSWSTARANPVGALRQE